EGEDCRPAGAPSPTALCRPKPCSSKRQASNPSHIKIVMAELASAINDSPAAPSLKCGVRPKAGHDRVWLRRNFSLPLRIQEAALEPHGQPSMAKPLKFLYLICRRGARGRGT